MAEVMAETLPNTPDEPSPRQVVKREKPPLGGSAIDLIEEAVHLLRSAPLGAWAAYYLGTLPFVLGFLYFWADMSRNAWAESHCSAAALGLALLFGWMKTWQAVFAGRLSSAMQGLTTSRVEPGRILAVQTLIHATGFIVLPISLVFMIPFGWCWAFYQNVTALGSEGSGLRDTYRLARSQAALWPGTNHIALLILSLVGLVVFINVEASLLALPYLLKSLFGVETLFTRSGYYLFNTTFLVISCGLTYLCVDPVVKAVYVLRCHHGRSIRSGQDIKSALAAAIAATAVCLALFLAVPAAQAEDPSDSLFENESSMVVSPEALDRAAQSVLSQSEYTWRLPKEKKAATEDEDRESGLFMDMAAWLGEKMSAAWDWLGSIWKKLTDWIRSLFPNKSDSFEDSPGSGPASPAMRYMLYIGLGLLALLAILGLWRLRKRSVDEQAVQAETAAASVPKDLNDNVTADQLPESGWMALADDLAAKGDFRLALRAMFLAALARLAEMELIRLARHKANWDYFAELARRLPDHGRARACFRDNLVMVDQIWYGQHPASKKDLDRFAENQREFLIGLQSLYELAPKTTIPGAPPVPEFDIHA